VVVVEIRNSHPKMNKMGGETVVMAWEHRRNVVVVECGGVGVMQVR